MRRLQAHRLLDRAPDGCRCLADIESKIDRIGLAAALQRVQRARLEIELEWQVGERARAMQGDRLARHSARATKRLERGHDFVPGFGAAISDARVPHRYFPDRRHGAGLVRPAAELPIGPAIAAPLDQHIRRLQRHHR